MSSKTGSLLGGDRVTITGENFIASSAIQDRNSLGMNLNGVTDYSPQLPFLDQFKSSRSWKSKKEGEARGEGGELDLDENGWVRSLQAGQSAERIFINLKDNLPFTRYVVRYEGSGTITYHKQAVKDEQASQPNRDVINLKPNKGKLAFLRITETDPNNYIRNISIVPEEYLDEYDRGEIFNPLWLDVIQDFRAIRFMNWMGTNHSKQSDWINRPKPSDSSYREKGVPMEVMVELANTIQADPWFNMPHLATKEYMEEFAKYVRNNLDPTLTVYIEHSNEVWNWSFAQARHANQTGRQRWSTNGDPQTAPANSFMQWHGMRTAMMCDIWKQVFAGETHRVHCTLGVQKNWEGPEQAALNCPKWVEEGHEACYKHGFDSIAVTTYFAGCVNGKKEEEIELLRSWFQEPDGGLTKGMEQIANAAHFPCDNNSANESFEYHKQVADEYGLQLLAYEGGQHITGNGKSIQNDEDFINFHIALNRDSRMYDRYMEMLNNWKNSGGTLMMHFVDVSQPSKYGSWGALESITQGSSPKYNALTEFNTQTACWWPGCERRFPSGSENPGVRVKFGDKDCEEIQVLSDKQLTCQTPKGDGLGSVDVTVEVEGKAMALPQGFTYIE